MDNPRDWKSNNTKFVLFHKKYSLGDEHDIDPNDFSSWEELEREVLHTYQPEIMQAVYLYDHSGISIDREPFSCKWDSGPIGWFLWICEDGQLFEEGLAEETMDEEFEEYKNYIES